MAGTLVISTISDGTNSTSATNAIMGSAKAWVNFNGTTAAIRTSYNVSSVTRNAVGDYTVNLTTALTDANFSVSVSSQYLASGTGVTYPTVQSTTRTTTAVRVVSVNNSFVLTDSEIMNVAIFR